MENKGGPDVTRLVVGFLRSYANCTQAELAEASGLSQSDISRYELGRQVPSEATLRRLAAAVKLPWAVVMQLGRVFDAIKNLKDRPFGLSESEEDIEALDLAAIEALLLVALTAYSLYEAALEDEEAEL